LEATRGLDLSDYGELARVPALLEDPAIAVLQAPSNFSDLYYKLFDNGRFWVEVLNWWGSDINIHDHDFTGVQFQLRGRSLNVRYRFEEQARGGQYMLGTTAVESAEVWTEGDRSVVLPGARAPHNVQHLTIPTVSLLIRTHPTSAFGPQHNYFPPHLKADYAAATIKVRKRIAVFRLLARTSTRDFCQTLESSLCSQSTSENIFTLTNLADLLFEERHVRIVETFAQRDDHARMLVESLAVHRASQIIIHQVKARTTLSDAQTLAASILASAFDRESFCRIILELGATGHSWDFNGLIADMDERLRAQVRKILFLFDIDADLLTASAVHSGVDAVASA
jgi:hypothetical protein